jgi:hypothetical protein
MKTETRAVTIAGIIIIVLSPLLALVGILCGLERLWNLVSAHFFRQGEFRITFTAEHPGDLTDIFNNFVGQGKVNGEITVASALVGYLSPDYEFGMEAEYPPEIECVVSPEESGIHFRKLISARQPMPKVYFYSCTTINGKLTIFYPNVERKFSTYYPVVEKYEENWNGMHVWLRGRGTELQEFIRRRENVQLRRDS